MDLLLPGIRSGNVFNVKCYHRLTCTPSFLNIIFKSYLDPFKYEISSTWR